MKTGLDFDMSAKFLKNTLHNLNIYPYRMLAGMANNHAGDKGEEGVETTQNLLESIGCIPMGASKWKGEKKGAMTVIRMHTVSIGVVNWTRWMNNGAKHKVKPNNLKTSWLVDEFLTS